MKAIEKDNPSNRRIDRSDVKWVNKCSFLNIARKDLKADFVIANRPLNDSDWSGCCWLRLFFIGGILGRCQAILNPTPGNQRIESGF